MADHHPQPGKGAEEDLGRLYFNPRRQRSPHNGWIGLQVLVGLGLIIGGAHLFVTEVESIAHTAATSALVLVLVLAPLASELPEKLNSVVWVRQGKDTLALGNITGAMAFQSTIPVAIGLLFVDWRLTAPAIAACACALVGGLLCLLTLNRRSAFSGRYVLIWLALYLGGVGFALWNA